MTTRTRARLFDSTFVLLASALAFIGICSAFHPSRAHGATPDAAHVLLLADASANAMNGDAMLQPAAAAAPDAGALMKILVDAVHGGQWTIALGALLLLVASVIRWLAADDNPVPVKPGEKLRVFFHTSLGGYVSTFLLAFLGTYGAVWMAGATATFGTFELALGLSGGVTGVFALARAVYQAFNAAKAGVLPPGHPGLEPTPKS